MSAFDDPIRLGALKSSGLLTKSVQQRVEHLAYAAVTLLRADAGQVNALDGEFQRTVIGWPPGVWPDLPVEQAACREPILTKAPLAISDTQLHPITCDLGWTARFRGYLGVPVMYGEQAIGSVCVFTDQPRAWKAYESQALVGVARLLTMSLGEQ